MKTIEKTNIIDEIVKVNDAFMSAVSNKDTLAISNIYTEDAKFFLPNGETVVGKENIQKAFAAILDSGIEAMTLESVENESFGDTAWESGTYKLYATGEQEVDKGKYIIIWKNVAGVWKYYRDIFNSDLPVSAPEA